MARNYNTRFEDSHYSDNPRRQSGPMRHDRQSSPDHPVDTPFRNEGDNWNLQYNPREMDMHNLVWSRERYSDRMSDRPSWRDQDMRYERRDRRKRSRVLNFERYAAEGNHFVNEVADELGSDRDTAARVLRAVIHAVRDRIPPDDAIQFAQGLPMALKGVFLDQYDISRTPLAIRHADDFIHYIRSKNRFGAAEDFPSHEHVIQGLQAVFRVLEDHMDWGQIEQVLRMLPREIVDLIY